MAMRDWLVLPNRAADLLGSETAFTAIDENKLSTLATPYAEGQDT